MFFVVLCIIGCSSSPDPSLDSGLPYLFRTATSYSETTQGRYQKLMDRGFAYYWRGDFTRTIHQLESALLFEEQSEESWAKYILYYCYMATGQYYNALKLAEKLVKTRPHESLSYQQVGLAQLWLGKIQTAIQSFQRALEFETHSPLVYFYLGLAEEKKKKNKKRNQAFQKAEGEYKQILKTNPSDFDANYELASLYLYWNKNINETTRLVESAKQSILRNSEETLAPEKSVYLKYYLPRLEGILHHRQNKSKESQNILFNSLSNAPSGVRSDLAEIYLYIGKNYSKLGEMESASSFLEKAKTMDPKGPYVAEIKKQLRIIASQKNPLP